MMRILIACSLVVVRSAHAAQPAKPIEFGRPPSALGMPATAAHHVQPSLSTSPGLGGAPSLSPHGIVPRADPPRRVWVRLDGLPGPRLGF